MNVILFCEEYAGAELIKYATSIESNKYGLVLMNEESNLPVFLIKHRAMNTNGET
jgi:hypothetical protein